HERRRENQPPGERQDATRRARAPAAVLVAHRDALDLRANLRRAGATRALEIALGLALEEIADAPGKMRSLAGDTQDAAAVAAALAQPRAALVGPMHDAMANAAQRQLRAMREGRGFRKPLETRRDPAAVLLGEVARLFQAAARRHGQDHLARRRLNAERIAARLSVPAHANEIDRLIEDDVDRLRFGRPTVEQGAERHCGRSPGARVAP